jgi:MFS family permease
MTGALHGFTHLYGVALLPLYLQIQADLKLRGVEQATLLVSAMGLAYLLPSYPLGVMADRVSRKKLLALGLAINGLGFVALAAAPGFGWALLSVVVAGIGGSFYHPAATALIARLFPEARGRALGLVGIGASVGFFLGPLYCGWRAMAAGSWRVPVAEVGVAGLVAAGLFAWLADDERDRSVAGGVRVGVRPRAADFLGRGLLPSAGVWVLFVAMCLAFSLRDFAGSAMGTSASLFLQNAHGFSSKYAGLALSGIFIMSALSNPLFGHLSDRGRFRWVALVLVVAAALMSVFPRVTVPWMVPVLLAYGFFFMASYPITEAALMDSVPDHVRGRIFGLSLTITGLIGNLSHWAVGGWVERLGAGAASAASYRPLFGVLSLLVLASLLALPLLRRLRRSEQTGFESRPAPSPVPSIDAS